MRIGFYARHYGWYRVLDRNPDTPASHATPALISGQVVVL